MGADSVKGSEAIAGQARSGTSISKGQIAARWPAISYLELALAGVTILILAMAFLHLDSYPATWFDEGSYLEVAQNLAQDGPYAAVSGDGTRDFAPVIGVGPTVLFPVAAILRLGESDSLGSARIVTVIYLIVASGLLYLVASSIFDRRSGLLTLLIALTLPALGWLETGRQVLGEVPAVAFLLLGGIVVARSRAVPGLLTGGAVLGLAMVTKGQYVMILPLAIFTVAVIDYFTDRARSVRWYVLLLGSVGATYAIWILGLLALIGDGNIVSNYRLLRESSSGALLVFDLDRMIAGLRFLLGPRTLLLIVPSLLVGVWEWRRGTGERRWHILMLLVFQIEWLAWFAFASIAWPRYAFPALALNTIFGGYLITRLMAPAQGLRLEGQRKYRLSSVLSVAVVAALGLGIAASGWLQIRPILGSDEREPQEFAVIIDRTVAADQTIDGWEPEINFLSDHRLIYPPLGSLDRVVRAEWLGAEDSIDFSPDLTGDYLVVGPFGRWVGVYEAAETSGDYQLVGKSGSYELFERIR